MRLDRTSKRRREAGSTFVMLAVFIIALFGFAALSLDVGNVLREQRKANTGTDAGALAAVMLLTNIPQNVGSVTTEAGSISAANGVTSAEINASTEGSVQVGIWVNNQFLANTTTNGGLYNAVRVPARRTVPLNFGKVVGLATIFPAVRSVAALQPAGSVNNAVPFGVTIDQVTNHVFGETLTLNTADIGSGKQGKIDIANYQNTPDWTADMSSTNGCSCSVSVGDVPVIPGNAQVSQSFNALPTDAIFIMPVVSNTGFTGNNGVAEIVGFVLVQLIESHGNGVNWTATVKFLDNVVGTGGGGTCPPPCVPARDLVS
jgi:Flp pilus assembly protein TadG